MIAVIGGGAAALCRYLEENGFRALAMAGAETPSLTALQVDMPEIDSIVLMPREEKLWSMEHILAAARRLPGRLIFYEGKPMFPEILFVVENREALLTLLKKPVKPGASGGLQRPCRQPAEGLKPAPQQPQPMPIPAGKVLVLGIVASQHRIGCTTQAVGLWHYCKALGFDPAIVADHAMIAQFTRTMQYSDISGGIQIEGIPFVTDMALAYDCYLLDLGPEAAPEKLSELDHTILVAGCKPWELADTAAALRGMRGKELSVLLSFTTQRDAAMLRPLFGKSAVAISPWIPNLWMPGEQAAIVYDTLLRPVLQRLMAEPERDDDLQLKGV